MSSSDALARTDAAYEPYIGLRPFEESERDSFFGRDREINILLDNIRFNRLTLLLAGSGVGKSSLLRAGVMPVLRGDSDTELLYHNVWSGELAKELKQAIAEHFRKKYKLAPFEEQFVRLPLKDMLRTCTMFSTGQQILLLDQFEEFFNYQRFREGFGDFVEELSAAVRDRGLPASFVFSMREDFALELNAFKEFLPGVFDNYFRLEKLTRAQARLSIEKPLERTGYSFAPQQGEHESLLDQVLDDLAKREQERQLGVQELLKLKELPLLVEPPHLQIVCRELWLHHRDEQVKQITHVDYEKAGRAGGILENYFIKIVKKLDENQQYIASMAFDYLIGSRGVKIAQPLDQLADLTFLDKNDLQSVLDILQDNAILRRKNRNGVFEYELYHDIFSKYIQKWNAEFKINQQERKPSYEELTRKIGKLNRSQQKLASAAFNVLSAKRNAKIRRPLEKLVELTNADEKELQEVLNKLHEYSILRRQKNDHVLSYEIYNDNLLEDVSKWNYSFNETSRRRRRILLISAIIISVCLLFAGNNWWANNYSRFLQLSSKVGISDRIEVYKGTEGGIDLFALRIFLYESSFLRQDLEADKLVMRSIVEDRKNAQANLTGRLSILERVLRYAENGLYNKSNMLAEDTLKNMSENQIAYLPAQLASIRTAKSVALLQQIAKQQMDLEAVSAIAQLGDISILVKLFLNNEELVVRQSAAEVLGWLGDRSVVPELFKLLEDKEANADVRQFAAETLGKIGDRSVASELKKFLTDEDENVRLAVAEALGRLEDRSLAPAVVNFPKEDEDAARLSAAEASGKLGTSELVKLLKDVFARRSAVKALGELDEPFAVSELIKLLGEVDINVKQPAVEALGKLGDSSATPALVMLLPDASMEVRQSAVKALGGLKSAVAVPILSRYLKIPKLKDTAANTLISMNISSSELHAWQEEKFKTAQKKLEKNKKQEASVALGFVFTKESVSILSSLLADANQNVVKTAVESLGNIGEYHPSLVQSQTENLLERTKHHNFNIQRSVIKALGQLISFQGKEPPVDLKELENKVHSALRTLLLDSQQSFTIRLSALDALGATGRPDCAAEIYELLLKLDLEKVLDKSDQEKNESDSLRYRSVMWLGRTAYAPAYNDIENELKKLEEEKAAWRKDREKEEQEFTSTDLEKKGKTWKKEHWEYMLGNALARIKPESTGIELLDNPLYQVRQGAIRALASRIADGAADATLIGKIIQAHQVFDPDDLPSPFPYTAFQIIDLALWNLEYAGTKDDLKTLSNIFKDLKGKNCKKTSREGEIEKCLEWTSNIPGQEGAIEERLEWTIKRLEENLAKNAEQGATE
ncbi:MAG: HEAT repeat domain-containing protein [Candidatus Electrothrix aestuarii]|uniref:HEAT repeat domain-containing protein n=1 Tax=Candidatus Electrothrix aestuarii TaxID=3062594 RepID=A0AAU8LTD3_9BACT|nr:HEAT repeat domain-containing protein [Candidatus Electrothrix aestuarii]